MVVTIRNGSNCLDIKADEKMKIIDTLAIVAESGLIKIDKKVKVKAVRENMDINPKLTFAENEIYNGDILEIIQTGAER